jgi:hypothetical protein
MKTEKELQFYRNQWPVLGLNGWENLADGFGLIWWAKPIAIDDPCLSARAYIVVNPTSAYIGLEVRHYLNGLATTKLGDAAMPANELDALIATALPGLKQQVIEQYQAWSDKVLWECINR